MEVIFLSVFVVDVFLGWKKIIFSLVRRDVDMSAAFFLVCAV